MLSFKAFSGMEVIQNSGQFSRGLKSGGGSDMLLIPVSTIRISTLISNCKWVDIQPEQPA